MAILTSDQMYNKQNVPTFNQLIVEFAIHRVERDKSKSVFTIRQDKEGYISLKRLFVSHVVDDPSEASFAEAIFGDVGYWLKVRTQKEIKGYLVTWREEADSIRKSLAFKAMIQEVREDGKSSFSAAKYLIEEPWKGRSRAVKAKVTKTTEDAYSSVLDDKKRLQEAGMLN